MRPIVVILIALFVVLQYQLWFASGGIRSAYLMQKSIAQQTLENKILTDRNAILMADIDDLKHGSQAIEERARHDLGMIKKGEVFYQVIK